MLWASFLGLYIFSPDSHVWSCPAHIRIPLGYVGFQPQSSPDGRNGEEGLQGAETREQADAGPAFPQPGGLGGYLVSPQAGVAAESFATAL